MIILISILLCFFPVLLIIYPLVKGKESDAIYANDNAYFQQRWDSLIEGLQNAELEFSIGTIDRDDYEWLQKTYTKEVAELIKELSLSALEEKEIIEKINNAISDNKK